MKKYYEYDAPVLTKLVSVVAIVAICVSMATSCFCCYKIASQPAVAAAPSNGTVSTDNGGSTSTTPSTPSSSTSTTPSTDAKTPAGDSGNTDANKPADSGNTDANKPADSGNASGGIKGLSTNEEILAKYKEVTAAAKAAKPAFKKIEYQALPKEFHNLGTIGNIILPIAEGFMTAEDKAEVQDTEAGNDMHRWPVSANVFTAASAIKKAEAKDNGDGTITLTIVLNDEKNPEPPADAANATSSPSQHGGMFCPMSKADIDNTIAGIKAVKVNSFELTYTDCTATLTYKADNNQVVSLTQIMNVDIKANVKAFVTIDGSARLINTMKIYDVKY